MAEPDYEIRGQTHWERHPGGGEPNLKVDRYHLIDLNGPGGHELSICGRIIDPTCSLPLDRWETSEFRAVTRRGQSPTVWTWRARGQ